MTSGAATQVGTAGAFTLSGTNFGFDFNPIPDRIASSATPDKICVSIRLTEH
jgi:hypothetical protein